MTQIISGMRFFPGRERVDGLRDFSMDRLDEVVVLAGPNGSGKTRILLALELALKNHRKEQNEILELNDQIRIHTQSEYADRRVEGDLSARILAQSREQLARSLQLTFPRPYADKEPSVLRIYPRDRFQFNDPNGTTESRRREVKSAGSFKHDFVPPFEDALVRIDIAVRDNFLARHQESPLDEKERAHRSSRHAYLKDALAQNIGALLGHDQDFCATINGAPLFEGTERFSNGQKKLLDFFSALDVASNIIKDTVILIDEPELYIHSGALIGMLDRLRATFVSSQMFVATHCVPLIAHLEHENVWWVSEGKASYSGRNTQQILEGLLGGAENVEKVRELTQEPGRFATLTYAYESLFPPETLGHQSGDPQGKQIADVVRETRDRLGRPIRLLDYGAGKGRLISALLEDLGESFEEFVDYVAFEPSPSVKEICEASILRACKSSERRFFSDHASLMKSYEPAYFDHVLLCNVMHEIPPGKWIFTFKGIDTLLNANGSVLIVEDCQIPHGEMAHSEGFIIADGRALQLLFEMDALPQMRDPSDVRYRGRLFAHSIPKAQLSLIDLSSLKRALSWCKDQSLREVIGLRAKATERYVDGILHGLWTQQFVNASIALEGM
jgi:energy-coupling factor transporter ATP-binding protein EcfA2